MSGSDTFKHAVKYFLTLLGGTKTYLDSSLCKRNIIMEAVVPEELHKCVRCGGDANQHGLIRFFEWTGVERSFCSYGCEFFWRHEQYAGQAEQRALAAFRV